MKQENNKNLPCLLCGSIKVKEEWTKTQQDGKITCLNCGHCQHVSTGNHDHSDFLMPQNKDTLKRLLYKKWKKGHNY